MLVQYYLVDHSLKMRRGKVCAQCAHGALLMDQAYRDRDAGEAITAMNDIHRGNFEKAVVFLERLISKGDEFKGYSYWREGSMAKIVLKCQSDDLDRAMFEFDHAVAVIDAGKTEIPENTRTVVVLPIMTKEQAPDWIKDLPLL